MDWYDNAQNCGGELYLVTGNTQAQGDPHDGTAIIKSRVKNYNTVNISAGASYLYQGDTNITIVEPSDHGTDPIRFDVIIACYNSDGVYLYNGPTFTDIHAIEIG
jgi:hypothetical protein